MTKLQIVGESIKDSTYARALHQLKDKNSVLPTFKQNVEVLMGMSEDDFKKTLSSWKDFVSGISYKAHSTQFKIIPNSKDLRNISKDFNDSFMNCNYNSIDGIALNSQKAKYNTGLTKSEVLEHPAWNELVGSKLLKPFLNRVYKILGEDSKRMGFYVREKTNEDQLNSLALGDLSSDCDADGWYNLYLGGRFLQVAQRGAEGASAQKIVMPYGKIETDLNKALKQYVLPKDTKEVQKIVSTVINKYKN